MGKIGSSHLSGDISSFPKVKELKLKAIFFRTRCEDGTPLESGKAWIDLQIFGLKMSKEDFHDFVRCRDWPAHHLGEISKKDQGQEGLRNFLPGLFECTIFKFKWSFNLGWFLDMEDRVHQFPSEFFKWNNWGISTGSGVSSRPSCASNRRK